MCDWFLSLERVNYVHVQNVTYITTKCVYSIHCTVYIYHVIIIYCNYLDIVLNISQDKCSVFN